MENGCNEVDAEKLCGKLPTDMEVKGCEQIVMIIWKEIENGVLHCPAPLSVVV